jgi:hypothetical protein
MNEVRFRKPPDLVVEEEEEQGGVVALSETVKRSWFDVR